LVTSTSEPQAKIALFRFLFRGREDVYPFRFENARSGRSGYAPACANEWVRGLCEKPRIKCAACPNRKFLAVTDEAIRRFVSVPIRIEQEPCKGAGTPPRPLSCACSRQVNLQYDSLEVVLSQPLPYAAL
jgi:hypothetical protein